MMKVSTAAAAMLLVAIALATIASASADTQTFKQTVPGSRHWMEEGRAHPQATLTLIFGVKVASRDNLMSELLAVSDPDSERYGAHFEHSAVGAFHSAEDTAAVVAFLEPRALSIDTTVNGDWVVARLRVADANALLQANFLAFRHALTDKVVHRTRSFVLPARVAAAVDLVARCHELPAERSAGRIHFDTSQAQVADACTNECANHTFPSKLWKAYNIPTTPVTPATGNSVSLFEALGQDVSFLDVKTFQKTYGVGANSEPVKTIGPNTPLTCLFQPNSCVEATLDVEYITAIAQGVPFWYWSIAASDETPFVDWIVAMANSTAPPLITSISYGGAAEGEPADLRLRFDSEVMKLGLRGRTVFVASGDDGVATGARTNPALCAFTPAFPASVPSITAVGGTQGVERGEPEVVCQGNTGGGITSGGGFSNLFPAAPWEKDAIAGYFKNAKQLPPAGAYNASGHGYPTIAAAAASYEIYIAGQVGIGSGTSASTPVFAGAFGLVNNARIAAGKKPLGFLNPAIYKLGNSTAFRDVTEGINNCCAGPNPVCCGTEAKLGGYYAAKGWDPTTGFGSFDFPELLKQFSAL